MMMKTYHRNNLQSQKFKDTRNELKFSSKLQRFILLVIFLLVHQSAAEIQKFCVITDAPINDITARVLDDRIRNKIPPDCAFLLHLGDYRSGGPPCTIQEFEKAATILRKSPVPVFPLLGDNDSVDCPNYPEGLQFWKDTFDNDFAFVHWDNSLVVTKHPSRSNFVIRLGDSLIFGLTILGGTTPDVVDNGLEGQFDWVREEILNLMEELQIDNKVGRVVIACHAKPGSASAAFFEPLSLFIENELENGIPILLLHGHTHVWYYEPRLYNQPSFLRINIAGKPLNIRQLSQSTNRETMIRLTLRLDTIDRSLPANYCFSFQESRCRIFYGESCACRSVTHGGNGK